MTVPANRFFSVSPLRLNDEISLSGGEFHHLNHVMRAKVGDQIELIDGTGLLATGKLTRIERAHAKVSIEQISSAAPLAPPVILVASLAGFPRLETMVKRGTELGASGFWFFPAAKSQQRQLSQSQVAKLKTLAISALKQSGSLHLPFIEQQQSLKDCIQKLPSSGPEFPATESNSNKTPPFLAFFGDLSDGVPKLADQTGLTGPNIKIFFISGPEGGWIQQEIDLLHQSQIQGVRLTPTVLPVETAAIAALAIIRGSGTW